MANLMGHTGRVDLVGRQADISVATRSLTVEEARVCKVTEILGCALRKWRMAAGTGVEPRRTG
jgi:hypothetical protein